MCLFEYIYVATYTPVSFMCFSHSPSHNFHPNANHSSTDHPPLHFHKHPRQQPNSIGGPRADNWSDIAKHTRSEWHHCQMNKIDNVYREPNPTRVTKWRTPRQEVWEHIFANEMYERTKTRYSHSRDKTNTNTNTTTSKKCIALGILVCFIAESNGLICSKQ